MTKETMSLQEVAEHLGLDEESIARFVATGQIPFTKTPEGIRFDKDAIHAFSYSLDCHSMEI
jgi:excisionase family DNA binding protein